MQALPSWTEMSEYWLRLLDPAYGRHQPIGGVNWRSTSQPARCQEPLIVSGTYFQLAHPAYRAILTIVLYFVVYVYTLVGLSTSGHSSVRTPLRYLGCNKHLDLHVQTYVFLSSSTLHLAVVGPASCFSFPSPFRCTVEA